jgi:hypothetical protein
MIRDVTNIALCFLPPKKNGDGPDWRLTWEQY